jgi:hypothetical protein
MHEPTPIPECFPTELYAGDSLLLSYSDANFPRSEGFTIQLVLNGPVVLEVDGQDDPDHADGFLIEADSAATGALTAGRYQWALLVFDDESPANRHTVARGTLEVLADPASQTAPVDALTFAREALAMVEAAILAKKQHTSFSVFGRSYSFESFEQLLQARRTFLREIAEEEAKERAEKGQSRNRVAFWNFGS